MAASPASARPDEPGARQLRGRAIEGLINSRGDQSLRQFCEDHLAPAYRDSFAPGELEALLQRIRAACADFGGVLAEPLGDDSTRLTFLTEASETSVVFRLQPEPPHLIVGLSLQAARTTEQSKVDIPPLHWDTLEQDLEAVARAGFSGTVLVVHGGKIVLHQGYGAANREQGLPNTTQTIFAIGSVPIDFTRAAILKLAALGKLQLTDPITRFLGGVPPDKSTITIEQLMTGRSGLPDFHHIPGVDADPDLAWIDRPTAISRILNQKLLFAPGQDEAHSHSAWVLLAAIVEIVSGQPYGAFLRQHFFSPAGMTRTGNHEDLAGFADDQFAVGYEGQSAGRLNIPKYWGRTSWLVMGSGGMASTPHDLYLWLQAIRQGKTLSAPYAAKYWTGGVLAGGDDRGFFCLYTEGPDDLMIMCSNAHSRRGDVVSEVGRRLVELVKGPR
jgi:CubicO group peptidase (beta-lactamase class C family)